MNSMDDVSTVSAYVITSYCLLSTMFIQFSQKVEVGKTKIRLFALMTRIQIAGISRMSSDPHKVSTCRHSLTLFWSHRRHYIVNRILRL